ncbi:helix-turn-helix domain-containing protein [Lysinibacillus sphaericus]|uniref:helix-turn-helix domain-containing protein n=1 Tax=Lysinibacillus sphaericus TaxID=1421 RepID=UPI003211BE17
MLLNTVNQKSNIQQYSESSSSSSSYSCSCSTRGRKPISDEKIELIKKLHLKGLSIRSIASIVRVGLGTVQKYRK